jgi:hypothetical protein
MIDTGEGRSIRQPNLRHSVTKPEELNDMLENI